MIQIHDESLDLERFQPSTFKFNKLANDNEVQVKMRPHLSLDICSGPAIGPFLVDG